MIYLQLLWVYLKIGTFGFGGGYAMLSLIQHELVDIHHWLTPQQFTYVVAISQMTPGPIGINSATYVGYAVTQSVWGGHIGGGYQPYAVHDFLKGGTFTGEYRHTALSCLTFFQYGTCLLYTSLK